MAIYYGVEPEHLLLAAHSVFHQTLQPSELIIVVDGVIDWKLEDIVIQISSIGEVRVLRLSENVGPGAARHAGIQLANSEIVAIMDSDDICVSSRFEKQYKKLTSGEIHIVGAWIREFSDVTADRSTLRVLPETHSALVHYAKRRSPMNNVTIMFYKNSYFTAGGYSSMRSFEDYDLFVRMILSGSQFYNVQEVLVEVRGGSQMFSRRGGLRQIGLESSMLFRFYKCGFYSLKDLLINLCLRTTMRLLPNFIRKGIYTTFLRKDA